MKQALLFLIDGMRPDALSQAETPAMDRLMRSGFHALDARTVMPSVTLPCITSLFLSTAPDVHGVTSNLWTLERPLPSLFEVVYEAGGRAASFYNWEPLRDLSRPGALQASVYQRNSHTPQGDTELAAQAAAYLRHNPVDFAFVYLGHTDEAGHAHGWLSQPYVRAIENADRCIDQVLGGLDGDRERLVVITSDHGGHDTHHGTPSDEDMRIPIILSRQPARDSGQTLPRAASILDIAPTIAEWMGLSGAPEWQGTRLF